MLEQELDSGSEAGMTRKIGEDKTGVGTNSREIRKDN
jgi:hypothetical protein